MKIISLSNIILSSALLLPAIGQACSSLAITDNKGHVFHGRTLELPEDLPSWLTFYPAQTAFQKKSPNGSAGAHYKSLYPILAITTPIYEDGDDHNMLEGMNGAGLSFSANMVPDATLTPLAESDYRESIPVTSLGEWALANFATVDEVRKAVDQGHFWSPVLARLGGVKSPFHFAFYDKNGGSIVVEALNGKFHVYDNPTKVMTNGPDFPWHLQNLNNYTQLTNQDRSSAILGSIKVVQPDSGIAASDLPSSDTSVGRFIRGVYYTSYAPVAQSSGDAINILAHIMNRFDRMKNITTDTLGGETQKASGKTVSEYTVWTALSDLSVGAMFVRGYKDISYRKFSLQTFHDTPKPVFEKINDRDLGVPY
ncbi:linear amide C-N hydrolase [Gluconobacter albidus]|uniref:linear amide C-N hydrolase n=1 Tax=Gluconobacter albidus TaxID=318683 RepID=UPI001B8D0043|nr:linear amide C-N hydrolase [Gluconobacter albidus]MBS1026868.1 linear amide C-N hydrolase [Gluconobacter albidus]